MERFDPDEVLDLVGCIYDVALSDDGWEPLLERMTALFAGTATVFFVRDRRAVETVFFRTFGLPDAALAESAARFAALDVGLDTPLSLPPGTITTEQTGAPQAHEQEAVRDFLERWDVERFIGGEVFRDARRFGVIAVLGSRHRVPFGEADHDCLQSLVPHLRRAVELRAHLDEKDASRSVAQDVIEGMLTGVVLLDEHGRVLMANAAARRIARALDELALAGERLRASSPPDDRAPARSRRANRGHEPG